MGLRKRTSVAAVPLDFIGFAPNSAMPLETVHSLPLGVGLQSSGSAMTNGAGNDRVLWSPFIVPQTLTIDRLGIGCIGGSLNSLSRLGIYRGNRSTMKPTTLLVDAGEVATASQGMKLLTLSTVLVAGQLYFFAYNCNVGTANSPSVHIVSGGGGTAHYPPLGVNVVNFAAATYVRVAWRNSVGPYGPLPLDATVLTLQDLPTSQVALGWIRIASVA